MESLKLIVIGIVQGLTELLPVSSSGHILILSEIFEIDASSFLLTSFHFGTTLAILLFFREKIFKGLFEKKRLIFLTKVVVSTLPAALVGILLEDYIEEKLRFVWITAVFLIVWGIVMIFIERRKNAEQEVEEITWKQSLIMGLSQSLALIPGTSRSGITTIAGIFSGLNKYVALEYSFILGLPILFGGFGYEALKEVVKSDFSFSSITLEWIFAAGIVVLVPFVVGYLSLMLLQKFKKDNWLTVFGIYRIVLGIIILLMQLK